MQNVKAKMNAAADIANSEVHQISNSPTCGAKEAKDKPFQDRLGSSAAFSLIRPSKLVGIPMMQVLWKQLPTTAEDQEELGPGEYHQPLSQRWEHRTRVLR